MNNFRTRTLAASKGELPALRLRIQILAGAVTAPLFAFAAYGEVFAGPNVVERRTVMASAVIAGAAASFLCNVALKLPQSRNTRRYKVLLGLLGAGGILLSALIFMAARKLLHYQPASGIDDLLFFALLGGFNAFMLQLLEWRRTREGMLASMTRLRSLEAQIQPHFFFNTLNTVSALIPDQPELAQSLIGRLAKLYRKILTKSDSLAVALNDEFEVTREYLEIERARFGKRLRFQLPAAQTDLRLPALTLQPLLENAVRHGIAKLPEGGEICVTLREEHNLFEIVVINPVEEARDINLDAILQEGHSLRIIVDRLALIYRGQARVIVEVDTEFTVRLQLPKGTHARRNCR